MVEMGRPSEHQVTTDDIDTRILAAEQRIKLWIVSSVLGYMVTLIGIGAPMIWYMSSLNSQFADAIQIVNRSEQTLQQRGLWMQDREVWENEVERFLIDEFNFKPPRYGRPSRVEIEE